MKHFIFFSATMSLLAGCATEKQRDSLSRRATVEERYRHQEPYSKERIETIDEAAGAESQTDEGKRNPFVVPKAGSTQEGLPQDPLPPQRP